MGQNTGSSQNFSFPTSSAGIYRSPVQTAVPGAPAWTNSKGQQPPSPVNMPQFTNRAAQLQNQMIQPGTGSARAGSQYAKLLQNGRAFMPMNRTQIIPGQLGSASASGGSDIFSTAGDLPEQPAGYRTPNAGEFNSDVGQYASQYGGNAFYFTPTTNYDSRLANMTQIGETLGMTPDEASIHVTGQPLSYWQQMQQRFDAGQHPTTQTQYDPNWKPPS